MAALIRLIVAVLCPIFLFVVVGLEAQERPADPVPVWPNDDRIPPQYRDRYVFLTQDKHTIVVLAPERPEAGIAGPKEVVRVPLWNDNDPIGKFSLVIPWGIPDLMFYHFPTNAAASWGGPGRQRGDGPAFAPHEIFDKPLGRYRTWFYQGDNLIHPGDSLGGFELQSSYLPGLTTAWLSSGRLPEFNQTWPQEIFQQLEFVNHPRWREAFVVTIGPMFPPNTPKAVMTETFGQDLDRMIKLGWLDESSTFAQSAVGIIAELRRNPTEQHVLESLPQTKTEMAVASALEKSLGVLQRSQ